MGCKALLNWSGHSEVSGSELEQHEMNDGTKLE